MTAPVPKRVILAVTSENPRLGDHKTGLFVSEALHPFNVFKKNGFEVDFVSETGKWAPGKSRTSGRFDEGTEWRIREGPSG
jgi:hypothetical protein